MTLRINRICATPGCGGPISTRGGSKAPQYADLCTVCRMREQMKATKARARQKKKAA